MHGAKRNFSSVIALKAFSEQDGIHSIRALLTSEELIKTKTVVPLEMLPLEMYRCHATTRPGHGEVNVDRGLLVYWIC
jgi:hypothetical protein